MPSATGTLTILLAAGLFAVQGATARAQETAESLIRDAAALYRDDGASVEGLEAVQDILDQILERHPASDIAVGILLQDVVGGLDIAEFQRRYDLARAGRLPEVDMPEPEMPSSVTPAPSLAAAPPPSIGAQPSGDAGPASAGGEGPGTGTMQTGSMQIVTAPDATAVAAAPGGPAADSCLDTALASSGIAGLSIRVALLEDGRIDGLPTLLSPENPTSADRLGYLEAVTAIESCAPYDTGRVAFDLVADAAGAISLVALAGPGAAPSSTAPGPAADAPPPLVAAAPAIPATPNGDAAPQTSATEAQEDGLGLDKQDYRDIQSRLLVLGHDPNGVDGVPGRGTRAAIRAWQQTEDIPATGYLDRQQLAFLRTRSQAALDVWLATPENLALYQPPPPIELGAHNIPGIWRFTTQCGSNSRIGRMTINGVMNIAHAGGNRYRGPVQQSQGFRGDFSGQLSGRTVSGQVNWGLLLGRVNIRGTVDDQQLAMRGRDSNGCSFYSWKS